MFVCGGQPKCSGRWTGWKVLICLPYRPKACVLLLGPPPGAAWEEMWTPGGQEFPPGLGMQMSPPQERPPICTQNLKELCE